MESKYLYHRFFRICRLGLGYFRSTGIADIYASPLPQLFEEFEKTGLQLFESALPDSAEIAFRGYSLAHFTTKYLPWTHRGSIVDIERDYTQLERLKKIRLHYATPLSAFLFNTIGRIDPLWSNKKKRSWLLKINICMIVYR
ncbi:hypothetical protein COY90_03265 [Candidatus Roizmanbacteria bacterium CG_4_10_14_0_8_um_filter_39_9]|uniref:Uncharacterized protein n=1 Tax=Candidatus Roizmanbacteria bacterium CG_4_10_14_0_8_um_filter_39_9 TaxID=1974829 RepID=A0A2M7QDU4_9BACT|nr:MAG: hypothetical protein COY90_03265 [Candidatus Roizmanbacteria bacterium CG_4_10_14_0_8_um_filter_39_9]